MRKHTDLNYLNLLNSGVFAEPVDSEEQREDRRLTNNRHINESEYKWISHVLPVPRDVRTIIQMWTCIETDRK